MNRQKTTLAVLLGLLALCAGAYLALRMWNSSHPPATDTISVTAFSDPSSFSFLGTDGETLSLLLDELSFLGFSSCYDYDAEESVLASCGLTEPALVLTVSYDDGQSFTLSVGQMDGDGTYRFALLNDSRAIQRLSASSIDVLMGLTQEQLLTAPGTEEDT